MIFAGAEAIKLYDLFAVMFFQGIGLLIAYWAKRAALALERIADNT